MIINQMNILIYLEKHFIIVWVKEELYFIYHGNPWKLQTEETRVFLYNSSFYMLQLF